MFRHKGKSRTFTHNLKIASLLSFVAGVVNVAGFLSVQRLTTNVTGHFAMFVDEVFQQKFLEATHYFLYILFFFLGSFFSGFAIEFIHKIDDRYTYRIPVLVESVILITVAFTGQLFVPTYPYIIAYALLFAMGLQNALVTRISNAVVRTTHLTGLFTDLGIEVSQLFFYKERAKRQKLYSSIRLRLTIISFFFLGGLFGGIFYSKIQMFVLLGAGMLLLAGFYYDYVRLAVKRKLIAKKIR